MVISTFCLPQKGTVIAIIAIREFNRLMRNKLQPVTFEAVIREPYGVKPLRKLIDGCAFRIYGHWVKRNKDENQNRAALFENKPFKQKYNGDVDRQPFRKRSTKCVSYDMSVRMASFGHFKALRKSTASNQNC